MLVRGFTGTKKSPREERPGPEEQGVLGCRVGKRWESEGGIRKATWSPVCQIRPDFAFSD